MPGAAVRSIKFVHPAWFRVHENVSRLAIDDNHADGRQSAIGDLRRPNNSGMLEINDLTIAQLGSQLI